MTFLIQVDVVCDWLKQKLENCDPWYDFIWDDNVSEDDICDGDDIIWMTMSQMTTHNLDFRNESVT